MVYFEREVPWTFYYKSVLSFFINSFHLIFSKVPIVIGWFVSSLFTSNQNMSCLRIFVCSKSFSGKWSSLVYAKSICWLIECFIPFKLHHSTLTFQKYFTCIFWYMLLQNISCCFEGIHDFDLHPWYYITDFISYFFSST